VTRSILYAFAIVVAFGCQGLGLGARDGCPVALVDTSEIAAGLRAQGTLRIAVDGTETTLGFALERANGTLTMVGFTPFGTRAFAIRQVGSELHVDDFVGRRMGVEPIWLADALHRALLVTPPRDALETAAGRRWSWGGEEITEHLDPEGAPDLRRFAHAAAGSTDVVTVEYPRSSGAGIEIDNPWCGYRAHLTFVREDGPERIEE